MTTTTETSDRATGTPSSSPSDATSTSATSPGTSPDSSPDSHADGHADTYRDCGCGERCSCDPPRALVRNLYFPRKLMDVEHWRAEQAYHRCSRELVTRLGLGSGVLCGLEVQLMPTGTLVVTRGVAVDGHGRIVIVPHDVEVDPTRLTDSCGRPEQDPLTSGVVTVSLCYHECGADLVRMPPEGCDDKVRCVPSMVREAFAFTVSNGAVSRDCLPDGVCEEVFGHGCQAGDMEYVGRAEAGPVDRGGVGDGGKGCGCSDARRVLLDHLDPRSCACVEACVPIAVVGLGAKGERRLDTRVRTVIRSNRELLDLILCLAERVDECCARTPAALAPRVAALWPWPDDEEQALADFAKDERLEIAFDRDMAEQGLDDPADWLGVWLLDAKAGAVRLELARAAGGLTHVTVPTGGDGAAYGVDLGRQRVRPGSVVVVMARSVPLGPIRAAGPDQLALDAELAGTGLTQQERDQLWAMPPATAQASYRTFLADAKIAPPAFLPSGDGAAGGELHVAFRPVVEAAPPRLFSVWPPGAADYGGGDPGQVEQWKSFLERPRLELVVSRALADAAVGDPETWLRLWQTKQDGDFLFAIQELKLLPGDAVRSDDGTVLITFPIAPPDRWYPTATCLAQLRSTPPLGDGSPLGSDDPKVLLDADFAGTALDSQTLFQIWSGDPVQMLPALNAVPSAGVQLWDAHEGGLVHWGFRVRRP